MKNPNLNPQSELHHKGEQMLVCATQRRVSALREWGAALKELLSMQEAVAAMKRSITDLEWAQASLVSHMSRDAAEIAYSEWVVQGEAAHRLKSKLDGDAVETLPLTRVPDPTNIQVEAFDLEKEYM